MTVTTAGQVRLGKAIDIIRRGTRTHYVYFIMAQPHDSIDGAEDCVKIGTTTDPDYRLMSIRTRAFKCPEWLSDTSRAKRIDYIGYVVGDQELEKELHRAFSDYRISGEWFALAPLVEHIRFLLRDYCVCRGCQMEGTGHAHI